MNRPEVVLLGSFLGALLILSIIATTIQLLPGVEASSTSMATTSIISTSEEGVDLVVNDGDTLIINPGIDVRANHITNHGTIINYGSIRGEIFGNTTNTGTIVNNGTLTFDGEVFNHKGTINTYHDLVYEGQSGVGFLNIHGGKINIKEGGSMVFLRGGSWMPHDLINDQDSLIDVSGSATEMGYGGMSIQNNGSIYKECNATYSIPTSGNPVIDKCAPAQTYTLIVNAVDLSDKPVNGIWTVIRSASNGTILKTGFTPLTFAGNSGTEYKVSVANYDGKIFQHWNDNASMRNTRTIDLSQDMSVTVTYDTGDSLRGFTSLTYTGTAEQPDLTVNAVTVHGGKTLHMWTIIDPQSTDPLTTTYKVYASNYRDLVFDHWNDGNADRIRTLTISENTTLTAYYMQSGDVPNKVEFLYKDCGLSAAGCGVGTLTSPDGTTTGPGPIPYAFGLTVSKPDGSSASGSWSAVIPGAAGPSGFFGTLDTLVFDGTSFKTAGDYHEAGSSGGSSGDVKATFSGQCGGTEINFEATNGFKGRIEGTVICTTV